MTQKYEPMSWLNPEDRIQGPCDRIDAGPVKILHQKEVFTHTIEIGPQKPGTPLGDDSHSVRVSESGLEIEICYTKPPCGHRKMAFAVRIQYCETFGHLIHDGPVCDELPPPN